MTLTCKHIDRAREKLTALIGKIMNSNDEEFYEKSGPWVAPSEIKISGIFVREAKAPRKFLRMIRQAEVEKKLKEIESILSSCSCYADEKIRRESDSSKREELIKSHREERKLLDDRLDDMKKTYEKITDKQLSLIETEQRETRLVRTENSQLQKALGLSEGQVKQLEVQLSEKKTELSQKNQVLERLRQAFQDLLVSEATYRTESRVIKEQLDWTKVRLENSDVRIAEKERKLEQKQQQYEGVKESLTNLRIKYKTETADKDNELKNKERELKLLKNQAEKSQKELLEERLELKEEKMEEFADELGVDLKQVSRLRSYYENLINARKNFNQSDISTSEYNITEFKQEILDKGISIKKVNKLCKKCEKVAEIRLELGFKPSSVPRSQTQTNTGYSFGRERSWKNINPNFTPELVQEWKDYGFTYEECADWININPANKQDRAIKEPVYYAWLRDVKQVDSYWVLNEGNEQKLSQEFFRWYQQNQYQARQEVPPRNNF